MRLLLDTHTFLWFVLDDPRHTAVLTTMPFHHKDPFDGLLIAQAIVEGIPIISADEKFDAYGVTRIW
ncbi:type II toxin-antitoxin system VapC family toxin [Aquisphaera insulae]|uniref:type II toxin-antitoxin system VapC family toxin n=1 Tax=Aquisphaera insulae TaxID=2712864 RepID=UPI0013EADDBE|nr:type II toxin-antitoxin system VapC family toxin [Aquisphaera insulae]